jgi:predicted nucleotidyltransferase
MRRVAVRISSTIVRKMRTAPPTDRTSDAGSLLFGKTRGRLLAWLYARPDERFYLRQLVALTGVALGAVQRELQLLTRAELVIRQVEGRQVYFQANQAAPIFPELQRLLVKTFGAAAVISGALAPVRESIEVAFLYGSAAKGTMTSQSDIDLLVVGRVSLTDVVVTLAAAQRQLGREVNPSVYPPAEFRKKLRAGHHFLTSVLREPKMYVAGTEHDLDRLAEVRLADAASDQPRRDRRPPRRGRA